MDEQTLLQQHIDVLFQQNEVGDLTVLNESPYDKAPQFYVGVTRKKASPNIKSIWHQSFESS